MQEAKVRFRRPTADEQTVLSDMTVKLLVRPQDIHQCDQILIKHHYLHSAQLVGEQLRYAVTLGKANGLRWPPGGASAGWR